MDIQRQQSRVMEITQAYSQQRRQGQGIAGETTINKNGATLAIFQQQSSTASADAFAAQNGLAHLVANPDFDLSQLQYHDKPILEMSQTEAAELISEDGYFGINKTAARLAQFVITGAGDEVSKLQDGRRGIIQGFKEAEKLWGGQLPTMSYTTLDKALEQIDDHIHNLGGTVVDVSA